MKQKVWDIPTRIFHWSLAGVFTAAFATSFSERLLEYHTSLGYAAAGLVVFRVAWGFAGPVHSRFSGFLRGPKEVKEYLAGALRLKAREYPGHNPAVGWAVVLILTLVLSVAVTGVLTYAGEEGRGVFRALVSFGTGEYAKGAHVVLAWSMAAVAAGHILAAAFHEAVLGERIVLSMITGKKELSAAVSSEENYPLSRLLAWACTGVAAGAWVLLVIPAGGTGHTQPEVLGPGGERVVMETNATWLTECAGACHGGFHPTLLPSGSWKRVVSGLDDHFGDDASLGTEATAEILGYLTSYSAERSTTEASRKILASLDGVKETPIRVTDTQYWKTKHSEIDTEVFGRKPVYTSSNCGACHPGAKYGSFEDSDIKLP